MFLLPLLISRISKRTPTSLGEVLALEGIQVGVTSITSVIYRLFGAGRQ